MILEVSQVDQTFRSGFWMKRVQVLHSVSLSVPEKAIFGFLGANGAGKTTLIQLIVGLRKPTAGKIRIGGYDSISRQARKMIGYLPERPYFYEHLTGDGLLQYFGVLSGMKKVQILDRIPKVLSIVGMSQARHVELRRYSKGMLQRIGIAQAILHDPEFLILDEPMSGLDPVGRKEMRELISRLAEEGKTVFFSTHVIPDVEAICDRVALIQKGRLIGSGPIQKFLNQGPIQAEVAFSGISKEDAMKISELQSVREMPDGMRSIVLGQERVNAAIQNLLKHKAQILWVTPSRPSLESYFEGEMKDSSA